MWILLLKGYHDKDETLPIRLIENKPEICHSEEKLSLKAAKLYLQQGKLNKMKSMLDRLPNILDRVEFLTENDQIDEAISTLKSAGGSIPVFFK